MKDNTFAGAGVYQIHEMALSPVTMVILSNVTFTLRIDKGSRAVRCANTRSGDTILSTVMF